MKTFFNNVPLLIFLALLGSTSLRAQDPVLPPGNLGITNLQDGNAPAPGWYYMQYIQSYQPGSARDAMGKTVADVPKISSLLAMQQVVLISKRPFLDGNLGFTVIVPLAKISSQGQGPTINPSPLGDVVAGPLVQWFNKKIFGMGFAHRFEVDLGIPVGAYSTRYQINPGSHAFRIFPHYTFTLSPGEKFALTMRHHINYYFREIGKQSRNGMAYNFNYSLEYAITKGFRLEIAGYYLKQFEQDSFGGDHSFYQYSYKIPDTRERVFAVGPGLGFLTPTGLFIEIKGMREKGAFNRAQGLRSTIVLSYKLDK